MARQEPSPSKTSSLLQQILYLLLCSFWQYSACQRIGDEALIQILGPPEGAEFKMAIQGTDGEDLYERRLGSYRVKDKPPVQTVTYAVGSFTK